MKHHTGKIVESKAENIKSLFWSPYDLANIETGKGLQEHDEGPFEDQMLK